MSTLLVDTLGALQLAILGEGRVAGCAALEPLEGQEALVEHVGVAPGLSWA